MRFWGLDTAGEKKRRLTLAVLVLVAFPLLVGAGGIVRGPETLCEALAIRDCEVLALAGTFLRF
jgi:hypothetical protein